MTSREHKDKLYITDPTDPNYNAYNNVRHPFYIKAYKAYLNARLRCSPSMKEKNLYDYNQYYGRGIRFKLTSFQELIEAIGYPPAKNSTLDREDNNGHYEVNNLRWVTPKASNNNTRVNRTINIDGVDISINWLGEALELKPSTIRTRLDRGWPAHMALMPLRHYRQHHKLIKKLNNDFGYDDLAA